MNANELDLDYVDAKLTDDGYLVLKDAELTAVSQRARADYLRCLKSAPVHAPREFFDYRSLTEKPWRKMAVGSANSLGNPYAQNLQTTYFDPTDANYPGLQALFDIMLGVRNKLMRVPRSFGDNPERDGFWNACRIHHYPRGGGHMVMHKDSHFPQVVGELLGKPFYQIAVLLSHKTEDFHSGGGFVVNSRGEKIDLEMEGGFGSLVLFDGRTFHGVDDVDLDQVIDYSRPDGRIAAFVNVYSVLK